MNIALDVQYDDKTDTALVGAVAFEKWNAPFPDHEWTIPITGLHEYIPGQFYKRELPCLLAALKAAPVQPSLVIVDGHVWLQEGHPGLGKYLYDALGRTIPVIGVAKRRFNEGCAYEWRRPGTKNPLFVTVTGMDEVAARGLLTQMHGVYRIPTLLKRVDSLARGR